MILFWGSKGYVKELGHTQILLSADTATIQTLGKLWKLDASSHSTGFHFFLTAKLISFLARFVTTEKEIQKIRNGTISKLLKG